MKARVKSTGVLIDVIPKINTNALHSGDNLYVCDNMVFRECELDFLNIGNSAIDWEQRRYELAKAAMQGILSDNTEVGYACSEADYRKRARGIIPEEHLKYWDKIVPIRLNDLYHGMELDCWLTFIEILNDTSKEVLERFERCRFIFCEQGHSGMSSGLVFMGLKRFHPLGEALVSYIKDSIKA